MPAIEGRPVLVNMAGLESIDQAGSVRPAEKMQV